MQDEEFPNEQLIEDLWVEGKWGFRHGALKKLAAWVISAKGNIEFLNEEVARLLATQEKITNGNHRKKKKLRQEKAVLLADNTRMAEILLEHLQKCTDPTQASILGLELRVNELLRRLDEKEHELQSLRTRVKAWRGAANALHSAFWRCIKDQDDKVPEGASSLCKWLIEQARKEDDYE